MPRIKPPPAKAAPETPEIEDFVPPVGAIEIARSYGATTVALTRPKTPLAAAAEVVIPIVIPEDANALMPTASRYAHMAVIDTVATDPEASLQNPSDIERRAAGEEDNAVLIGRIRRLPEIGADVERIEAIDA